MGWPKLNASPAVFATHRYIQRVGLKIVFGCLTITVYVSNVHFLRVGTCADVRLRYMVFW